MPIVASEMSWEVPDREAQKPKKMLYSGYSYELAKERNH